LAAIEELRNVQSFSTMDLFASHDNQAFADIPKHSKLAQARNMVQNARICLENVRRHVPALPNIQLENIQSLNAFVDTMFEGMFLDATAQMKLQESIRKLEITVHNLYNALQWIDTTLKTTIFPAYTVCDSTFLEARTLLTLERRRKLEEFVNQNS